MCKGPEPKKSWPIWGLTGGCGGVVKWAWLDVLGLPGPVGSFSTVN